MLAGDAVGLRPATTADQASGGESYRPDGRPR